MHHLTVGNLARHNRPDLRLNKWYGSEIAPHGATIMIAMHANSKSTSRCLEQPLGCSIIRKNISTQADL